MVEFTSCQRKIAGSPGRRSGWLAGAFVSCLLIISTLTGAAASFTATLDRDTITLGETATLVLTFEGGTPAAMPIFPDIPNLQISASGNSTQLVLNNGQATSTVVHTFQLVPRQPSEYMIPALTVEIGGQKLTTQSVLLKVLKATASAPEAINSGAQVAFLKLVVPKKEVYVGESFTAQLQF